MVSIADLPDLWDSCNVTLSQIVLQMGDIDLNIHAR